MLSVLNLLFLLIVATNSHLSLKKCCPFDSQITAESMTCSTESINELDNLFWIPINSTLNGTSRLNLDHYEIIQVKQSLQTYNFSYGNPDCLPPYDVYPSFYEDENSNEFRLVWGENENKIGVFVVNNTNTSVIRDIKDNTIEPWLIPLSDVCLDVVFDPDKGHYIYIAQHCPTNATRWIKKCCPIQQIYNVSSQSCVSVPDDVQLTDWRPQVPDLDKLYVKAGSKPQCEEKALLMSMDRNWRCRGVSDTEMEVEFLPTGALKINGKATYETDEYCGESTWHEGNRILHENFIVCGKSPLKTAKAITYGVLFIFGGIFLLLTVALSLWLPELRTTMHNKVALTHNATLMFAYFAWGISQIAPRLGVIQCTILSLIIQFTFLGSFVWLNAMCIEMSSSFRKARLVSRGSWKRYLVYSAYAWGLTTSILILTVVMEFVEEPPWGIPRPGISCYCGFARHNISILLYFYGPMAIALMLNLVLYLLTTWKIIMLGRAAKILNNANTTGGTGPSNDKQRLIVYTKLFVLMGLTWITEVIGWGVHGDNAFWFIMDIINLLRAIFIFVIFICKRPILQNIKHRITVFIRRDQGRGVVNLATIHGKMRPSVNRRTMQGLKDVELKEQNSP